MNKGVCVLCGTILLVSISLTEGAPLLCHDCEKKKQFHVEVSQPTGMIQQVNSTVVAGISVSGSVSPSPSPEYLESEV